LRPELVNRIDEIVLFRRLGRAELRCIIDRYARELEELLASRQLTLSLDDAVYDRLLEWGSSDRFGARELRRVVDRHLRQPLAQKVLERDGAAGEIRVTADADRLKFD
jgi:ATP-dependent Clp protease ATP-binding subunit ClpB